MIAPKSRIAPDQLVAGDDPSPEIRCRRIGRTGRDYARRSISDEVGEPSGRDTLAVAAGAHAPAMIYIECAWCDTEVAVDGLDATSVECPDCNVTVDIVRDEPQPILVAA